MMMTATGIMTPMTFDVLTLISSFEMLFSFCLSKVECTDKIVEAHGMIVNNVELTQCSEIYCK
jgi:hypothetical protein